MSWLQASCLLLLAWAIMSTQARSIAKTKREIEIPYKNVTNMEMELEENPQPTNNAITIDPDIVVGTESERKLVTEETTNREQPVGENTTPSLVNNPELETKLTTPTHRTTTESMPIVVLNATTTRSSDQGRSMQIFMTTERSFSVTPMKLQPLIISTTARSTAMPAQAASHENAIDEDSKSTTAIILGHQLPEKRAKFISENSTNAQQLSPEVWGLAAMMNSLPKSSTTSTTTESILPNDIETQDIDKTKNITGPHYEKNVLDWQNVENMRENRTEFVVSTTLDATEGSAKAVEETTESLRNSKITESAELNITESGTTTVRPSVNTGLTEEPLVQKVTNLTVTSKTSTTTIATDLAKQSESMVTTTTTESTSEALNSKLQFIENAHSNEGATTTKTGLSVEPVIQKLDILEETTVTPLDSGDVVVKTSTPPEASTTTESAKINYVDLTPAINSDLIINTKTTSTSAATTLEPEPEAELVRNLTITTTPKPDLTGEPVVQQLATAEITEPAATPTTTTPAATVHSNDLNLAASTPSAIHVSNELKQTTSTATTPTSNDLYLTAAKMLELTEATTTTEPSAVTDITKNITTHNHPHMPNTETTTTTSTEMAMKTTTITTTEAYDVTSSASTNKDSETASQRATVEQLGTATTPKEIVQISNEVEITTVRNFKEIEADKINATTTTTARTTASETAEKTNNNNNNSESEVPATTIIPTITTTATTITEIIDNRLQNLTETAPAGANQTPTIANNTTSIGETKPAATDLYDEDNNGAEEDDVADVDDDVKRQQVDVDNNTVMATTTTTTPVPPLISLLDDSTSTSSTTTTTTTSTTPLPSTTVKMLPEVTTTPAPPPPTTLSPVYSSSPNPSPSPSPTPQSLSQPQSHFNAYANK
ncbi:mucin-5AC-like [Drosophila tropicalis]|uniref:mucin-5AC-like n=1 Tax=Drosophila tropicalis TaxID=46794 RepID=UPI0035AB71D9